MWLRTGKEFYYRQSRFWTRIFVLNFGIGVVSGLSMEFAFGWGPVLHRHGNFIGNILGFETVLAFATEAGFLGIMIFGWNRVPPPMHLFATAMVVLGGVFSAFWIMPEGLPRFGRPTFCTVTFSMCFLNRLSPKGVENCAAVRMA